MKGPSLQKTAALSAALHLTLLLVAVVLFRHSSSFVMPSPYVVNLVSPEAGESRRPATPAKPKAEEKASAKRAVEAAPAKAKPAVPAAPKLTEPAKKEISSRPDSSKMVDDRIAELEAKRKVEQIVRLRSVISLKATGEQKGTGPAHLTGGSASKGTLFDSYYAKITEEIWSEWIYPDLGEKKQLEAVIFVRILRDGTIHVQGVERSSGNLVFDRSALRALAKASPVSVPPHEMELGIRFYP